MRQPLICAACVIALAAPGLPAQESASLLPRSFAYVLQAEGLAKTRGAAVQRLQASGRDWLIIDPAYDDGPDGRWTREELLALRGGKPGRKVLAYLSIGEAENYRSYWRREWDANRDGKPDPKAPGWLCAENPDWKGNYRVRYWQEAWQDITLQRVDEAVRQGFDGIYLDIVDAFELFEYDPSKMDWLDNRVNPETGRTYREDMIAWVGRLAQRARQLKAGCLVVPQNGVQLLERADFVAAIDAIGVEDLFTDGKRAQPADHVRTLLGLLKRITQAQKPVLVIEYGAKPKIQQRALEGAKESGFALLVTERELKTLGQSHGPEGK